VHSSTAAIIIAVVFSVALPLPAAAAGFGDRLLQRAKEQVERGIENTANQAVDKSIGRAEEAIRCASLDQECIRTAEQQGQQVIYTDGPQAEAGAAPAAAGAAASQRPGEGAWANFDFVPGDRVLFAEDFSADRVGNFPRRLDFQQGNMEIVEWGNGRYLRSTAESAFDVVLPEALSEGFTIEFDLYDPDFWASEVYPVDLERRDDEHTRIFFSFDRSSGMRTGGSTSTEFMTSTRLAPTEKMMRVSTIADGRYVKVFLDETRIVNVPNADLPRSNRVRFRMHGNSERPVLIGNIRVAAGSTSLYDRLSAEGSVATQGILFDTGSDRIRPESTPTLWEIADMLSRHPDLRLRIEGHTDNVGDAAANQQLSERRAEAVRQYLVASRGVDAARLTAVGKGQSEPAGSNDTPEGRQNNRRVVLVKT
jgi:OmpA-OmpF porin, OOP family